jgi:hypothetical protein
MSERNFEMKGSSENCKTTVSNITVIDPINGVLPDLGSLFGLGISLRGEIAFSEPVPTPVVESQEGFQPYLETHAFPGLEVVMYPKVSLIAISFPIDGNGFYSPSGEEKYFALVHTSVFIKAVPKRPMTNPYELG